MLEVRDLSAAYGKMQALFGVSFHVAPGEILCVMGRNGTGKTTTMKTIMGLVPALGGSVSLDGAALQDLPAHQVSKRGLGYIPQGRRLFSELTVAENIEMGLMTRGSPPSVRDWVLELFPRLSERLGQRAETLSGGEQQMLATARALCIQPQVLLLDEPTEGLQPSMIALIRDVVLRLKAEGLAVVLVEQKIDAVLEIADRVVFLETGRSVATATPAELKAAPEMLQRYLGV